MSEPGVVGTNNMSLTQLNTLPQPENCDENTVNPDENEIQLLYW